MFWALNLELLFGYDRTFSPHRLVDAQLQSSAGMSGIGKVFALPRPPRLYNTYAIERLSELYVADTRARSGDFSGDSRFWAPPELPRVVTARRRI